MRHKNESLKLRIKEYIEDRYKTYGRTPTTREIAAKMRISPSTSHRYLRSMHDDGMITYADGVISTRLIGIDDGDLVVIREQKKARIGDIVVAMDNENRNTLKRLEYDSVRQSYYLHPENPAYEDIYPKSLDIQGIATHAIKAL